MPEAGTTMVGANKGGRRLNLRSLKKLTSWMLQKKQKIVSASSRDKVPLEMASKDGELRVFIVADRDYGDYNSSRLMASLKKLSPFPVRFAGVGGHKMSSEGLKSLFPLEDFSSMGTWERLRYLNTLLTRSISSALKLRLAGSGEDFRAKHAVPSGATVISVLPGGRLQDVTQMLPIFANTVELLKETFPQLMTVIHVESNRDVENYIAAAVHKWPVPVILIPDGSKKLKYDALRASRVALYAPGSETWELQLARTPCVFAYRGHVLLEWILRTKIKEPYACLANIVLNSAIIPEALFHSCSPGNLASLLKKVMHDNNSEEEQIVAARKVFKLLCKDLLTFQTYEVTSEIES